MKAVAIAAVLALIVCFSTVSVDVVEEQEYDTDLGQKWSYEIQFVFTGGSASKIAWDFGDGSEPISDDASDGESDYTVWNPSHVYAEKGVYYVTQTVEGSSGNMDTAAFRIEIMGYPYVTLVYDNGQSNGTIQMESGGSLSTAAAQPEDPARSGYTFTGWYTTPECEELYDWSTVVKKPVTVYAGWTENAEATITFDVDDGLPLMDPIQVTIGTEYTVPGYAGTKEGCTFGGWHYNGQTYLEGQKITVSEDITLKAYWIPIECTVTFDSDGGSDVPEQKVQYGSKAIKPDDPTRSGYMFEGWRLDGTPYDFDTPVTGNITLVADWSYIQPPIERHTVTFDPANGEETWAYTVVDGDKLGTTVPELAGHIFDGWYTSEGTLFDFDTPIKDEITLTAKWRTIQYTVTFDSAGGSSVESQTVYHGSSAMEPSDPSKSGYNFEGWYLGSEPYDFRTPVTADITLTAQWSDVPATDDDDGESNVWYLVGAIACAIVAGLLVVVFYKQASEWYVLVGMIVAIVVAMVLALFYAGVL